MHKRINELRIELNKVNDQLGQLTVKYLNLNTEMEHYSKNGDIIMEDKKRYEKAIAHNHLKELNLKKEKIVKAIAKTMKSFSKPTLFSR